MIESSQIFDFIVAFILAIITGAVLTYFCRNLARSKGWVSQPASHHIHEAGIPRLGGVAVYTSFMLLYVLSTLSGMNQGWRIGLRVIAPASLLFLVGLADDFRSLPAWFKLCFQIIGGALLFASGVRLVDPANLHLQIFSCNLGQIASFASTIAWVVLITNAFNLIDGLDGLAAGSALFSIIALFGFALVDGNAGTALAALILGGAVLGFLRYNFNPATIFLGDSGSLFLGFMLAGLALQPSRAAAPTLVAVTIPMISFGLPIVETAVSVVRRFLSGKPLFTPDQDHFHHRLLRMGLSHRQAVIALYGICAACALLSFFLVYPGRSLVGLVLIVAGTMFCVVIQRLDYAEFREFTRLARRTLEQKRVIANDVVIRNVAHMLELSTSWRELTCALDSLLDCGEFDSYSLVLSNGFSIYGDANEKMVYARLPRASCDNEGYSIQQRACWELRLDLQTSTSAAVGQFTIGRAFRHRSVLLDLNLIFEALQPALSTACERLRKAQSGENELRVSASADSDKHESALAAMHDPAGEYIPG